MDRGTKLAIGFGLGLTAFSGLLILAGDVISWGAGLFNNQGGASFGSSVATTGWVIVGIMAAVVIVVVGVWIYDKLHSSSGGYYY